MTDGWTVSESSLAELFDENVPTGKALYDELINMDMKTYGEPALQNKLSKGVLKGPIVLQVTRVRDVGRPSIGGSATGLYRIVLTDGQETRSALTLTAVKGLTDETLPGTKVRLTGDVPIEGPFLLLSNDNCTILGGKVDKLIEKFNVERNAMRGARSYDSDAPKWVSFGKRGTVKKEEKKLLVNQLIKSDKKDVEDDGLFEKRRKEAVAAAAGETEQPKFTKISVAAPQKTQHTEDESILFQQKKMEKKQAQKDRKPRRGRRGGDSDDDGEVPIEFAPPTKSSTLFDFVADKVGVVPIEAPPPPIHQSERRDDRRGGRQDGYQKRNNQDGRRDQGGDNRRNERTNTGRSQGNRGDRKDYGQNRQEATSSRGQGTQGYGNQGRNDGNFQNQERNNGRNQKNPGGRSQGETPRGNNQFNQGRSQEQGGYGRGQQGWRGANEGRDGGVPGGRNEGRTQDGRGEGRYVPPKARNEGRPGEQRKTQGGSARGQGESTGGIGQVTQSLMQMHIPDRQCEWQLGQVCQAPWSDGQFYRATIVFLGPRDLCTVRFIDYGDLVTVPQGVLIA